MAGIFKIFKVPFKYSYACSILIYILSVVVFILNILEVALILQGVYPIILAILVILGTPLSVLLFNYSIWWSRETDKWREEWESKINRR